MPKPDGTRTRDEHWTEIATRADRYLAEGLSVDDAIERAGEDHREAIKAEGERKIAEVMKFLGIKSP
jgi:hypothetical protein